VISSDASFAIDIMGDIVVKVGFICVQKVNDAFRVGCFIRDVAIAAIAQDSAVRGAPCAKLVFNGGFLCICRHILTS